MDRHRIGRRLLKLRLEHGETAYQAAKAVGISPSAILMYENGERIPRDDVKILLSRHYGVSVASIFFAE